MGRRGPEGKLQDKITADLREHDVEYKKREAGPRTTQAGWPDLDIYPGDQRIIFVEVKAPGEGPAPLQEWVHGKLRKRGYKVYVIDNYGSWRAIMRKEKVLP